VTLRSLALAAALVATPALAMAAPACRVPGSVSPAPVERVPPNEVQRGVTTAYYLLSLSWSPEWCRTNGRGSTSQRLQCGGPPRGFILHGLWPNGAAPPYPRYCNPVGPIDARLVKEMFCRTPSPELLQHEWQAHGSCGWTDPGAYFGQAARLYDRIVMPRIEEIDRGRLTAGTLRRAFTRANRWMSPDMLFVAVDKGGRLSEVRVCYDLRFQPAACRGGTGTPDRIPLRLTNSAGRRF
jgi:ribonuclease T2